jgi:hypothetical protein
VCLSVYVLIVVCVEEIYAQKLVGHVAFDMPVFRRPILIVE